METISLKTFATTGLFGLRYGWYEFFFWTESNALFAIQNDSLSGMDTDEDSFLFKNEKFTIAPWFFKTGEKITYRIVQEILNKENIPYTIKEVENSTNRILFKSDVYFDFIDEFNYYDKKTDDWLNKKIEHPEDYILNGIRIFDFG